MIRLLFTAFVSLLFLSANAQTFYTVTGKVFSATTGQPLQGASVFAQNTTLGTATDEDGSFSLNLPNGGYDLVVTFTGYNTASKRVTAGVAENKNVNFVLNEKDNNLEDVVVVASNEVKDGLEKYGAFFRANFLGLTANSHNCKIVNEQILKFYYYKRTNKLKVMAAEPLQIENTSLGYTIKYALDSFVHEYNSEMSIYTGSPLFTEMYPEDSLQQLQWKNARDLAYKGSTLQFMRSVYNRNVKEQGFEVQQLMAMNGVDKSYPVANTYSALHYEKDDSTLTVEIKPNLPRVGVLYKKEKPSPAYLLKFPTEPKEFQFSILTFDPQESIVIEQNGYYYDQNDLIVSGYWGWEKVGDLLPYDYEPTK